MQVLKMSYITKSWRQKKAKQNVARAIAQTENTSTATNTQSQSSNYGGSFASGSVGVSSNPWGGTPFIQSINPDDDRKQEVSIRKDKDNFTVTREELYRLIFMLEENGQTIETCSFDDFITALTAVRL